MDSVRQVQEYRDLVSSICDGCALCNVCKGTCRRKKKFIAMVDDYDALQKSYNLACSELVLGSQYFMNDTVDEVKKYFRGNSDGKN